MSGDLTPTELAGRLRSMAHAVRTQPRLSRDVLAAMLDRAAGVLATGRYEAPRPMPLTKRQVELVGYLRDYITAAGYAPTYEEIADRFGYRSLSTVHEHLSNIEHKGHIRRHFNRTRGIEVCEVAP